MLRRNLNRTVIRPGTRATSAEEAPTKRPAAAAVPSKPVQPPAQPPVQPPAQPPVQPPVQPEPVRAQVPTGTINEVMDWVGGNKVRAAQAISVERSSESPRSTLLARLTDIIES